MYTKQKKKSLTMANKCKTRNNAKNEKLLPLPRVRIFPHSVLVSSFPASANVSFRRYVAFLPFVPALIVGRSNCVGTIHVTKYTYIVFFVVHESNFRIFFFALVFRACVTMASIYFNQKIPSCLRLGYTAPNVSSLQMPYRCCVPFRMLDQLAAGCSTPPTQYGITYFFL